MNDQLIKINNTNLQVKEFNNKRVVTLKDIDTLHERVEGTADRNFRSNQKHFRENEDYFILSKNLSNEIRGLEIPNRGITVLTESGYLMLVKSFTDDLAWEVQRQLIKGYFRSKNDKPIGLLENLQSCLEESNKRIAELEQIVFANERKKLSKREKQLGISAPAHERISLIPDEEIMEIIKIALENGLLRELDNGIAIDKKIVLEEAEKRHIAKQDLNKKLLLMSIVIPNCDNYAYRQIVKDGFKTWCYVIKDEVVNE